MPFTVSRTGRLGAWPRGEAHPKAKLNDEKVRAIRRRWTAGESGLALAAAFGVSQSTISSILHGRSWEHVEDAGVKNCVADGGEPPCDEARACRA